MRVAIPTAEDKLCMHFGHCDVFKMFDVTDQKELACVEEMVPPPHEPGVLPKWMSENAVDVIIAGGMGVRAQDLFKGFGIEVVTGASAELTPEELLQEYLNDTLVTGTNACSH